MTLAATDTFNQTVDTLISDAVADLTGEIGKSVTGRRFCHAIRALERLIKRLDANGSFLWRFSRRTIALTAGTATYALPADVLDLDDPCVYRPLSAPTTNTVVVPMSRDDYTKLADRTNQGLSSQYLFERTLSGATVTLWPVPDTTGDTLEYVAVARGKDAAGGGFTMDFPTKWLDCLRYGLAASLAPAYNQVQNAIYWEKKFEDEKERLLGDDTERGNITLAPVSTGGGTY